MAGWTQSTKTREALTHLRVTTDKTLFCWPKGRPSNPDFSSGIVERAKRDRAWKSPYVRASLPADVRWGSFVRHMNAWQTNPNGRLRGGYVRAIPEEKWSRDYNSSRSQTERVQISPVRLCLLANTKGRELMLVNFESKINLTPYLGITFNFFCSLGYLSFRRKHFWGRYGGV